jgi:hypothetical protein
MENDHQSNLEEDSFFQGDRPQKSFSWMHFDMPIRLPSASRAALLFACFSATVEISFSHGSQPSASTPAQVCGFSGRSLLTTDGRSSQHRCIFLSEISGIRFMGLRGGGGDEGKDESKKKKSRNRPTDYRLFVANLPQGLNDDGLLEAFEPFGDVEEARVGLLFFIPPFLFSRSTLERLLISFSHNTWCRC